MKEKFDCAPLGISIAWAVIPWAAIATGHREGRTTAGEPLTPVNAIAVRQTANSRDRFNYTEWRRQGLPDMALLDLAAAANQIRSQLLGQPKVVS